MLKCRTLVFITSLFIAPTSSLFAASPGEPSLPYPDDGCSCFPETGFEDCCRAHDKIYYRGGSEADRAKADRELRQCIRGKGHTLMGDILYYSVRVGGVPWVPTPWRWGFGHPYLSQRGYAAGTGTDNTND
jgi:hypothetical protein